mmetsp:Transcript_15691/g.24088  ORF Transcript_15691/g.24088 Transcript_15691/m.24088 type:complete len:266 (+) Transcript_15691:603-1400(+)
MFSHDGNHLVVWESPIKNNLQVYQLVFDKEGIQDIQLKHQYSPYESTKGLGLRNLQMAPNKQFALGGYCDGRLRLINALTWREVFAFNHAANFDELDDNNSPPDLNIYVESESVEDGPLYEAVSKPFKIEKITHPTASQVQRDTDLPRVGVSKVAVSHDSTFVASVCEQCPLYIWIWDLEKLTLNSVIMQKNPVDSVSWAPNSLNLNICSADSKIFLWSLRGASVCQVPAMTQREGFKVTEIMWNQNGKNFAAVEENNGLVFVYP